MAKKQKDEADFRAKVMANPQWKAAWGGAGTPLRRPRGRPLRAARSGTIARPGFAILASLATTIVQYVAEIRKPDAERLPGFHDSQLESTRLRLFSPAPVYPAMDIARLTGVARTGAGGTGRERSLREGGVERTNAPARPPRRW